MLEDAKGELEWQKWQRQLEIISNIHKLQEKTIKIIEHMPIVYDIKSDIRYQQGTKVGIKQGIDLGRNAQAIVTVISILLKSDFSSREIALMTTIPMPFVTKWEKILAKYKIKKIWNSFEIDKDNKKEILERRIERAKTLIKIKDLSDEIIGELCGLKKTKVTQIRIAEKKKLANGERKD